MKTSTSLLSKSRLNQLTTKQMANKVYSKYSIIATLSAIVSLVVTSIVNVITEGGGVSSILSSINRDDRIVISLVSMITLVCMWLLGVGYIDIDYRKRYSHPIVSDLFGLIRSFIKTLRLYTRGLYWYYNRRIVVLSLNQRMGVT